MADPRSARFTSVAEGAFFGRVDELAHLQQLDGAAAWLCGPPGVGKTRLAREFAARLATRETSLFVDLLGAADEASVLSALASALDVPLASTPRFEDRAAALAAALRHDAVKTVILDNADACAAAAERLACAIAPAAPQTAVLVTSRERREPRDDLRVVTIEPFAVPAGDADAEADAVQYFLARVQALGAEYAADDLADVTRLVRRLDGIPLALELAAFRTNVLTAGQLLTRIEATTAVLEDPRGVDPRHATLLRAVETSWELMQEPEKACLASFSIFESSFDVGLAEAASPLAAGATLDALGSLRRRSMLLANDGAFALLASIREFAASHLVEEARNAAIQRVAAALDARADRWIVAADLHATVDEVRALKRARPHLDLVLWQAAHPTTALLRARLAVARLEGSFADQHEALDANDARVKLERGRGFIEANQFQRAVAEFDTALAAGGDELRAEALADRAFALLFLDDLEEARQSLEEATAAARPGSLGDCRSTMVAAGLAHTLGRRDEARALYERTLQLARRLGDHRSGARVMQNLGVFHTDESRFETGRRLLGDAIAHHNAFGDRFREAWGYNSLGVLELRARRREDATRALRSARMLFEAIGLRAGAASVLANLSMIATDFESYDEAREYALDAISLSDSEEDGYVRATSNLCLAVAYWFLGRKDDAGFIFESLEDTVSRVGHIQLVVSWLGAWAALLASIGDARAEDLFRRAETSLTEAGGDETLEQVLRINRLHLEIQRHREAVAAGDRDALTSLFGALDAAREAHFTAFGSAHTSEPLRYSVRLLQRELPPFARSLHHADVERSDALLVSRDLQAFRPVGGVWTQLGRSPSLWRLFEALVEAQLEQPGSALDLEQLQDAVWPGELLTHESATNRLYVSITKLRKGGLAPHLEKVEDGYRLTCEDLVVVTGTGEIS